MKINWQLVLCSAASSALTLAAMIALAAYSVIQACP